MSDRRRSILFLLLRIAGFALAVWVLASQVRLQDEIVLADGTALSGEVSELDGGAYAITLDDGTRRELAMGEIEERREGVPNVTYGFETIWRRVAHQPLVGIGVLLVLAAVIVLMGWRWQALMRAVDLHVGFGEAVRLTFVGGFFNLVVPGSTGGDVVKAYYAAKRTHRGTRAVLSVFVDRLIGLFVLVVVAALALLAAPDGEGYAVARVTVYSILAASVLGLVVVGSRRIRGALRLRALVRKLPGQRIIEEIRAAIRLYRGHPRVLVFSVLLSVINQVTLAAVVWALAQALEIEGVSLLACFALVPITNLLSAIPLVPGGWGVGELAFAYFFGQIGVPATEAVALSVLYRLSFLLVNVPGGLFWITMRDHPTREEVEAVVDEATEHVDEVGSNAIDETHAD